eukprot:2188619-Rhodomonas_salina.1
MNALRLLLILICTISVLYNGYNTAVGVSNMASTVCATLSSVLAADAYRKNSSLPQITAAQADKALSAMLDNISSFNVYFLDSCCSYTIVGNGSV